MSLAASGEFASCDTDSDSATILRGVDGADHTQERVQADAEDRAGEAPDGWLKAIGGWLPQRTRMRAVEVLFAEAFLLYYILIYGTLLDSVCSVSPLGDAVALDRGAYGRCSELDMPFMFETLKCSRWSVPGSPLPAANVSTACCHLWAMYEECADAAGFPRGADWLAGTFQHRGTVGVWSGPFAVHNSKLLTSRAVLLVVFLGGLAIHYHQDDEDQRKRGFFVPELDGKWRKANGRWRRVLWFAWENWQRVWSRVLILFGIGMAHSASMVAFGGARPPGRSVCWTELRLQRDLNIWLFVSIIVVFVAATSAIRDAWHERLRTKDDKSVDQEAVSDVDECRRYIGGFLVVFIFVVGVSWGLVHREFWISAISNPRTTCTIA